MPYEPIENYGVIGDLQTVALVGMNGSIDFMCFPHFDSPSIFAALLDHKKGGCFQLAPILRGEHRKQIYFPDTNMLLTRFLSADGVAEVSDFMPIKAEGHAHHLVRRAKAVRGELSFRMICAPAFDYGRAGHKVEAKRGEVLFTSEAADRLALRLRTSLPVRIENGAVIAEFKLAAGETAAFVLENAAESHGAAADPDYVVAAFKETLIFWRRWVPKSSYKGRCPGIVTPSALTINIQTFAPTGAVVAAPTFGLPEEIGGERNWDYRFTWIRDASFTVYGLIRLGYTHEAAAVLSGIVDPSHECSSYGAFNIM